MTKRIIFILIAVLFLVTSLGFSLLVIWQSHQQSKQNQQAAAQQTTKPKEGQLQGTQLKGFTPVAKVDTLQATDIVEGTGPAVKASDTITVHYTGAVAATGIIFQSSLDSGQPVAFPLNQVIKGWTEGIPGMKAGGTRRLLIPAADAYGATPPSGSGIPANADLVFDVQLIKIGQ
ncbi:MAG TPA: FKBP-type peptidyl-prolyl cis-trans isomerase [Patescibacteria group bacterium]|nr:FKBP-type peptidyl-prolyl cis-trans isomerase [Patescibacteria group bacterium]